MNNKFRHNLEFKQIQLQKPKTADDAVIIVGKMLDELNNTHSNLQDTFQRLEQSVGASGNPTITLSTNTTNSSSSQAVDFKANQIAVSAGSNIITFAQPMTSDYVIIPIYISSMIEFLDPTQIVYDVNKFTVIVPNDGILVYVVIPKKP
jgi:hypothetical protein